MKEITSLNNSYEGGRLVKKTLTVLTLSAVLVLGLAANAFAAPNKNAHDGYASISQGAVPYRNSGAAEVQYPNKGYLGYLVWSSVDATTNTAYGNLQIRYLGSNIVSAGAVPEQASGPHANYAINTIKCATCHSAHMAPNDSWLLTNITTSQITSDTPAAAGTVCAYCHSASGVLTEHRVSVASNGNLQGHSVAGCSSTGEGSCHGGAHGVGVSTYETLASKLINAQADDAVDEAITLTADTGMTAADFDITGSAMTNDQNTFAVSYLCATCHQAISFANKEGMGFMVQSPGVHGAAQVGTNTVAPRLMTAHPMLDSNATATASWETSGSTFTGQIAWASANGCVKCHSKVDPVLGTAMFPHATADNYNDAATLGGSNTVAAATSGAWLKKGSFAGSTDTTNTFRRDTSFLNPAGSGGRWGDSVDGVCLGCHRGGAADGSGVATAGVGIDF